MAPRGHARHGSADSGERKRKAVSNPARAPVEQERHKIIVGVDYGTTFSGVSYVTTDKSDIDDINIISKWPGDAHTSWKTPTRIAYKAENPSLQSNKWGFEVNPKLTSYSWTKLLLDKNAAAAQYDDPSLFSDMSTKEMMRLPNFRDAPGVCEDFLREVFEYVSAKLRREMTDFTFKNTPMECWITLPAIWSDEAKDATLQAAKRAGFGNRPDDEIFTIAEPEAAAIATLKKYTASGPDVLNPVKPNDNILILDCGGGTVDITTYTITQVEPRLDFEELCVGIGGKCGSTYIDRKLHALLSQRGLRDFGLKDDLDERELGPINLNIPDSVFYDGEEKLVKLSYDDMQDLFDPVIQDITQLVGQQVRDAKSNNAAKIDRIILVGGFGESPYLFKELGKWCRRNGGITLMCPDHPQSAVVRGAALRGLEGIAPRMKRARRHYGIGLCFRFREGTDPEELAYIDEFDNIKMCRGRGEKVFNDTFRTNPVSTTYTRGQALSSELRLFSCGLSDPPDYVRDPRVQEVGSIVSKFDRNFDFGPNIETTCNSRLGRKVNQFPHQIQVRFGDKGENLQFKNLVKGLIVSEAVIEFGRH
ncbi:Hsp70 family protein-like protein [Hyaloscypha finlandica]|nr:Hsp70 family protein-like protein [Hyaloscypha finlandica]